MVIDVHLSISRSLKSDKIKGIRLRIKIETGINENDFHGFDNCLIGFEIAKLKVQQIQNVSFSWN